MFTRWGGPISRVMGRVMGAGERRNDLLERNAEVAALGDAIGRTGRGHGGVVIIEGPAGIGKTRLLQTVRQMAADDAAAVAWARASELERDNGFGVLRQLLEPVVVSPDGSLKPWLFRGAARLAAPIFQRGSAADAPTIEPDYAMLHGLYWLLAEVAGEQPLAVCIDDVQWADPPSLRFLAFTGRRVDNIGVTLFGTLRSGERGTDPELVSQLTAEPGVVILRPRPLTEVGVAALARDELAVEPSRDLVGACLESTGGNPFFLKALLTEITHRGADAGAASVRRISRMGSDQVAGVLLRRLRALPPGAIQLAQAVAVLGDGVELGVAAQLAGVEPHMAIDGFRSLVEGGFLVGQHHVSFTHPIVRSSVYGVLLPLPRSQLHKRAAALLQGRGARIEDVASHLLHVLPEGDAATVVTLWEAARHSIAVGAPESAVGFLKRALGEPPAAVDETELLLDLGRAEMRAGIGEAVDHLEQVVNRPSSSPVHRGLAALDLGELFMHTLRGEEAVPILEAGIAATKDVEPALAKRIEATLLFNACGSLSIRKQLLSRLGRLQPPVGVADSDPSRLLFAVLAYDQVVGAGTASAARFFAEQCLAYRSTVMGSTEVTAISLSLCGLTGADQPDEAEDRSEGMIDIARSSGSITLFSIASANRALARHRRGNLAGAEADARTILAAESAQGLEVVRPLALSVIVNALTLRGDLDAAEAAIASIDRDRFVDAHTGLHLVQALIELKLAKGQASAALKEASRVAGYEAAWRAGTGVGLVEWRWLAAAAHAAAGAPDAARALADEQLSLARSFGSARALGIALRTSALLDADGCRIEMLREAVDHLPQERSALERTRTLVELGTALRRSGHPAEARAPLHEGLDLAGRCGALVLAQRAHTELRAAGGHPRSPRHIGLEGLTPSERRVADMAAEGLTNKEVAQALFVTVKTVEMHLASVFRKLGIRSRSQLHDALTSGSSTGP